MANITSHLTENLLARGMIVVRFGTELKEQRIIRGSVNQTSHLSNGDSTLACWEMCRSTRLIPDQLAT